MDGLSRAGSVENISNQEKATSEFWSDLWHFVIQ